MSTTTTRARIAVPAPHTRNVTRVFRLATGEELAAGRSWYGRARELAEELATLAPTGDHEADTRRAAAVIAVLSPRLSWPANVKLARRAYILAGHVTGQDADVATEYIAAGLACLKANGRKAGRLLAGEDPADVVSGAKVSAFYRTIVDPSDALAVVVDRHAVDVAVGRVTDDRTRGIILGRAGAYAAVADCYSRAARILSRELGEEISPAVVQAVTWTSWRRTRAAAFHGDVVAA